MLYGLGAFCMLLLCVICNGYVGMVVIFCKDEGRGKRMMMYAGINLVQCPSCMGRDS